MSDSTYRLEGHVQRWVWLVAGFFTVLAVVLFVTAFVNNRLSGIGFAACFLAVAVLVAALARIAVQRGAAVVTLSAVGMEYAQGATVRFVRWDDVARVSEVDNSLVIDVASAQASGRLVIAQPQHCKHWQTMVSDIAGRLDCAQGYSHRLCQNRPEPTPCSNAGGCSGSSLCQAAADNR